MYEMKQIASLVTIHSLINSVSLHNEPLHCRHSDPDLPQV